MLNGKYLPWVETEVDVRSARVRKLVSREGGGWGVRRAVLDDGPDNREG